MQFINWGHESPEQKAARDKWEADLYEAMLIQKAMTAMTPTGGGFVTVKTSETLIAGYYNEADANSNWKIRTYNFSTETLSDEIDTGLKRSALWSLSSIYQVDYHKGFAAIFDNEDTLAGRIIFIDCNGVNKGEVNWSSTDSIEYYINTFGAGWSYVILNSHTVYFFDGIDVTSHTWQANPLLSLGVASYNSTFVNRGMLAVSEYFDGIFQKLWVFYDGQIFNLNYDSPYTVSPNKNCFLFYNADLNSWELVDLTGTKLHSIPGGNDGNYIRFYGDNYIAVTSNTVDESYVNFTASYYDLQTGKSLQKTFGPFVGGDVTFSRIAANEIGNYDYPNASPVAINNTAILRFSTDGPFPPFFNQTLTKMETVTICPIFNNMESINSVTVNANDFGQVFFGMATLDNQILFGKESIVIPFTTNGTDNLSLLVIGRNSSKIINLQDYYNIRDGFALDNLSIIVTGEYLILKDNFTVILINEYGSILDIVRSQDNAVDIWANYGTICLYDNVSMRYKNQTSNQFIELTDADYSNTYNDLNIFRPNGKHSGTLVVETLTEGTGFFRIISTNKISKPISLDPILSKSYYFKPLLDDGVIVYTQSSVTLTLTKYDLAGNIVFDIAYPFGGENNTIAGHDSKYYGSLFNFPNTNTNVLTSDGRTIRFPDATSTITISNLNDHLLID